MDFVQIFVDISFGQAQERRRFFVTLTLLKMTQENLNMGFFHIKDVSFTPFA